jgi:hypothetical protein
MIAALLLAFGASTAGPAPASNLRLLFDREALDGARLDGLEALPGEALRVSLRADAPVSAGRRAGTLETAPQAAPAFDTAVLSWNAATPEGASLKLEVRARFGARWSRYYDLAVWTSDPKGTRTSFEAQRDADGRVDTDTLRLERAADAWQARVTLSATATGRAPVLTGLAAVTSDAARHFTPAPGASDRAAWGVELSVPSRSQMIYQGGGEVWCSPTSVTMLLLYWSAKTGASLADPVPDAARATWDRRYDGAGNWPFNTAYAATKGLRAYVTRLGSLAAAEAFVRRGVPLALSIAWKPGELRGAHIERSGGHLVVLRGFAANGDPIINDPAASADARVRTVYDRAQFERAWVGHSGGIAYVVEPPARP